MTFFEALLIFLAALIGIPICAYLGIKAGMSGYYRAKERQKQKEQNHNYEQR